MRAVHDVHKKTTVMKEMKPYIEDRIRLRRKKGHLFRHLSSCGVQAMRLDHGGFEEATPSKSSSALKAIATPIPITTKKVHEKFRFRH